MKIRRILVFLVLLALGFVGLAMTVSGGAFLVAIARNGGWRNGGIIIGIALGSLAMGVTLLFVLWRVMRVLDEN